MSLGTDGVLELGLLLLLLESIGGVTATGVLDIELDAEAASLTMLTEVELGLRCQRPRTPSTALKKPVDPAVSVREIASRVGANCCSNLSSWIPSASRRLISATTDGFSLQGCLKCDFFLERIV